MRRLPPLRGPLSARRRRVLSKIIGDADCRRSTQIKHEITVRREMVKKKMLTSVAIVKGKNGKDLNEVRRVMGEVFTLIGPASQIIPPNSRVLIKPNLTAEENLWEKGILTGPVFMQALVEEVQKANPAEIVVA